MTKGGGTPADATEVGTCGNQNCKQVIFSDNVYFACEICAVNFHLKCSSYTKTNLNSSILKVCDICTVSMRKSFSSIKDAISFDVLARLNTLEKLFNNLEKRTAASEVTGNVSSKVTDNISSIASPLTGKDTAQHTHNDTTTTTYAPHKAPTKKVNHQIIITPKADKDSATFADKLKSSLKTIPVKKVNKTTDGREIFNFPSKQARDKALECLKDFNPVAEDRDERHITPKITIFGLSSIDYNSTMTTDEGNKDDQQKQDGKDKLLSAIKDKNPHIKDLIDKGKCFEILFIKNDPLKDGESRAVVKVDVEILSKIRQNKYRLFVDFSSCRISDRVHIVQCYKCQKYGHTKDSKFCEFFRSEIETCMYCTGNHRSNQCEIKSSKNSQAFKCSNCVHANNSNQHKFDTNHPTTSDKCQVRQRQINKVINRTIGFESAAKNYFKTNAIVTS